MLDNVTTLSPKSTTVVKADRKSLLDLIAVLKDKVLGAKVGTKFGYDCKKFFAATVEAAKADAPSFQNSKDKVLIMESILKYAKEWSAFTYRLDELARTAGSDLVHEGLSCMKKLPDDEFLRIEAAAKRLVQAGDKQFYRTFLLTQDDKTYADVNIDVIAEAKAELQRDLAKFRDEAMKTAKEEIENEKKKLAADMKSEMLKMAADLKASLKFGT